MNAGAITRWCVCVVLSPFFYAVGVRVLTELGEWTVDAAFGNHRHARSSERPVQVDEIVLVLEQYRRYVCAHGCWNGGGGVGE
jgi:hypothetical protein